MEKLEKLHSSYFDSAKEVMRDIAHVLNRHSIDNELNIPDFILAEYVFRNLMDLKGALNKTHLFSTAGKDVNGWGENNTVEGCSIEVNSSL
jgi:hypothetical protein